jgi:DNA-binding response OmpR family regulator
MGSTQQKKVLVVDDSRTALMMSMTILSRGPYVLVAAHDGEEAVAKAKAERPDLIVMDVVMPRMTGIEACAELRRCPETRKIPVLLLTTRGEEENVIRGLESGCTEYLTKPINGAELLAKIRQHLAA